MKIIKIIIFLMLIENSYLFADSLSIFNLKDVDKNIEINGQFNEYKDSVIIEINILIKNNTTVKLNPIALCLNEIKIFSPKRGIGDLMSWLNQNSPTSCLLFLDTAIKSTIAYTHGNFFRHYKYLPLFIYIYDSARINIIIPKSDLTFDISDKRIVFMCQFAKVEMLDRFLEINDLTFENRSSKDNILTVKLTQEDLEYYADNKFKTKSRLSKKQVELLSILFMNYAVGIFDYKK